jgi:acetoacetyl-CoA synthetase
VDHRNDAPLWVPSAERIAGAGMTRFRMFAQPRTSIALPDSAALHHWSISDPAAFWDAIWDFCTVIGDKGGRRLIDGDKMPGARFFPDSRLNFAENLLRQTGETDALVLRAEDKATARWSWDRLHAEVSRLQQAMRQAGVGIGDRVAGLLPNIPEAVAAMLAATSIGAVWSSASPDFGPRGILDRFGQIEPKLLITVDGYWYAGKHIDMAEKLAEIAPQLPSVTRIVLVDLTGNGRAVAGRVPRCSSIADFVAPFPASPLTFERLPFDHPLAILFSSGTTGVPKCIVHRAGGVLLQHLKEHVLHADTRPGDRIFYFTTLGWMMWNWLVGGLAAGATLLLFDGSPFHPKPNVLFNYAEAERMTLFGTSAKYIDSLKKIKLQPHQTHDLSALRTICSTGSPLSAESFDYVYRAIKADVHLASISGGTDIVSCFVLGDPTRPVYRGEIQGPGLGMAVEVWTDDGTLAPVGEKGELVCTAPFPVMPLQFWNDPGDTKYRAAYFERFDKIWCHGDFAERTAHGGLIIHGRSDATLNPGGVRIGTAEIYAQVEQIPEILEGLAIGQDFAGDVRIVLFVRLREGAALDAALEKRIRSQIRDGASPRHVPAKIIAVADIPRTKSGKITELAVRDIVHGRSVKNKEALANPEALDLFRDIPALKS